VERRLREAERRRAAAEVRAMEERKRRQLTAAVAALMVLVISGGFWLYARQTERLAYDQIRTACRLLVSQIMDVQLATGCRPVGPELGVEAKEKKDEDKKKMTAALAEFRQNWESHWPATAPKDYTIWTLKLNAKRQENMASPEDVERLKEFQADPDKNEDNQLDLAKGFNYYYGAVRASKSCLGCHRQVDAEAADLRENDLLAVIKVRVPTEPFADGIHANRALLISIALAMILVLMAGSFLILRVLVFSDGGTQLEEPHT
jgi:hypothetical protein